MGISAFADEGASTMNTDPHSFFISGLVGASYINGINNPMEPSSQAAFGLSAGYEFSKSTGSEEFNSLSLGIHFDQFTANTNAADISRAFLA